MARDLRLDAATCELRWRTTNDFKAGYRELWTPRLQLLARSSALAAYRNLIAGSKPKKRGEFAWVGAQLYDEARAGVSVDAQGWIYAATGNAFNDPENSDFAEHVVKLDPDLNVVAANAVPTGCGGAETRQRP